MYKGTYVYISVCAITKVMSCVTHFQQQALMTFKEELHKRLPRYICIYNTQT